MVSTHSRPKAAGLPKGKTSAWIYVSTHSRPKAAGGEPDEWTGAFGVSTHSRPKAAGCPMSPVSGERCSFNTQPPEGGWFELRLQVSDYVFVSTHSRPKAAGRFSWSITLTYSVSTHSRPKAAGASLKSLAPSGFAAPISLGSQEKRERKYNTAFSVTPAFAIS